MTKRAFIIHGWDGYPKEGWFPWLKEKLEERGFVVQVPAMPYPEKPRIGAWVGHLSDVVGEADENTFFVGHSIGCQAIMRYLEMLPPEKKIGGAVFVAGWFKLQGLSPEEEEIAEQWLERDMDFGKVMIHTKNFYAIFSDNDPWVSLDNEDLFKENLGAKTIIEQSKGHINGEDGVFELPSVLKIFDEGFK